MEKLFWAAFLSVRLNKSHWRQQATSHLIYFRLCVSCYFFSYFLVIIAKLEQKGKIQIFAVSLIANFCSSSKTQRFPSDASYFSAFSQDSVSLVLVFGFLIFFLFTWQGRWTFVFPLIQEQRPAEVNLGIVWSSNSSLVVLGNNLQTLTQKATKA